MSKHDFREYYPHGGFYVHFTVYKVELSTNHESNNCDLSIVFATGETEFFEALFHYVTYFKAKTAVLRPLFIRSADIVRHEATRNSGQTIFKLFTDHDELVFAIEYSDAQIRTCLDYEITQYMSQD